MNLYRISQSQNKDYNTYDSAVVAAETDEDARNMDPANGALMKWGTLKYDEGEWYPEGSEWCQSPDHVVVEFLGVAKPWISRGVICASYNAA
jgi:hypothetical protein